MSRESKLFSVDSKAEVSDKVKDYESFGWELLSINGTDVSMSRETQNPVYIHLLKYEDQYEALQSQLRDLKTRLNNLTYKPISLILCIVLLLLLIFPGVLYIRHKLKEKSNYKKEKQSLLEEINQCEFDIKRVVNDSRATFFAKQS